MWNTGSRSSYISLVWILKEHNTDLWVSMNSGWLPSELSIPNLTNFRFDWFVILPYPRLMASRLLLSTEPLRKECLSVSSSLMQTGMNLLWWEIFKSLAVRRVWRYQRDNQNPYIEEKRQHKVNGQKKKYKRTNNDQQNISYKTKDRVIRTPLKTGRVRNSCSTSDTRRVNLVFILIRKCYEVLYSSGYRQG